MELLSVLVWSLLALLLLLYLLRGGRGPGGFPPGPPTIPVLGSIPFLRGVGMEKYMNVLQYGKLAGLYTGSYPMVVINDWRLAKEMFTKEVFSGRMSNFTTEFARSTGGENLGLITTQGKRWSGQRSFTLKHLKNFGFGSKSLGVSILDQANQLVKFLTEEMESWGRVEMNNSVFQVPILNVLWDMVAGTSFKRGDPEITEMLEGISFIFASPVFMLAVTFPWFRFIFPSLTGYNKRLQTLKTMQSMIRRTINQHRESLDEEHARDFIDSYLIEMNNNPDPEFRDDQLVMVCFDMMAAGADTTSTTLLWTVLYLALYPEIQENCFKEIIDVIETNDVSLFDIERLNLCQATIAEVQRLAAVAVGSVQHTTTQQVSVEGYTLPKNCLLISNIQHFLSDPALWNQPALFNPGRFLDEHGKFYRPEYFVPLGHGKRVCMGEPLARAELAIFFVTLVQKLKFSTIRGEEPNTDNYTAGFTRTPQPFPLTIAAR